MKTLRAKTSARSLLMLFVAGSFLLSGCVDTRYTIRQVDQHPAGRVNTVETSGERVISLGPLWESREYLGINYWNCSQDGEKLTCSRVCDDTWNRVCSPGLRGSFGTITKPDAGVVLARYVSREGGEAAPVIVEERGVEEELDQAVADQEMAEELQGEEVLEEVEE